jgi:hypothetical protein
MSSGCAAYNSGAAIMKSTIIQQSENESCVALTISIDSIAYSSKPKKGV